MLHPEFTEGLRVPSGKKKIRLKDYDTDISESKVAKEMGREGARDLPDDILRDNLAELREAQEKLYAANRFSVLLILQAMDAAGKDGTIKHVMSGVNPQGCQVYSFKQPSPEELDHDFLWRCAVRLPERGRIGIFNRSYYEEVLVVRVHPKLLERQQLPPGKRNGKFWRERYESINGFEQHLARNGTVIVKFFLHISKGEQKKRFLSRLDEKDKHWKFSLDDLRERAYWDDFQEAYEEALSATSTEWAPWYVIPADQKWATRAIVADILVSTLAKLDLRYPEPDASQMAELEEGRRQLEAEK